MAHLQAGFQQVTTTLWVQKKVRYIRVIYYSHFNVSCIGWAPSQFVSSRVEKANPNSRKPEDFMDEEVCVCLCCVCVRVCVL